MNKKGIKMKAEFLAAGPNAQSRILTSKSLSRNQANALLERPKLRQNCQSMFRLADRVCQWCFPLNKDFPACIGLENMLQNLCNVFVAGRVAKGPRNDVFDAGYYTYK